MRKIVYDWYEILEEQSDCFCLDLAFKYICPDIDIIDPNGFMVVDSTIIPIDLKPFLAEDRAIPIVPFVQPQMVLLKSDKLRKYLADAKSFTTYDCGEREYIQILFEVSASLSEDKPERDMLDAGYLEGLLSDSPMHACLTLFSQGTDKEVALQMAYEAKAMAISKIKEIFDEEFLSVETLAVLLTQMLVIALVAVIFAWNRLFEEAEVVLLLVGNSPATQNGMGVIFRYYLEMLILYEQSDRLAQFFAIDEFRERYLSHYEIYMKTFVEQNFQITRVQQITVIENRLGFYKSVFI
jgi:hypothetical protein